MPSPATSLTSEELHSAIVPDPLVVSPDITVADAIVKMCGLRSRCEHPRNSATQLEQLHLESRSSCVIVMESQQIIGILTERDVVRLAAQQQDLGQLIRQVMTQPVITLHAANFTDIFAAVNYLQQQQIRHLPILNEHNDLVGIVTHETLQYTTRLLSLLRLRQVEEVMNRTVICASTDNTLAYIVQQMVDHRISSVVIVEPLNLTAARPIGIITERDLVQFQALGLSLATTSAQAVMSTSPFSVQPTDSLWSVQQMMAQHFIHRVVVTGEQGELLGIVTQGNLLKTLNPHEIFNLAAILEAKVQRLEAEKVQLLENRTYELEQLVEARTSELKRQMQREACITKIASQIRDSLKLQEILDICVSELRTFLDCDRMLIEQFQPDGSGIILAESVGTDWRTTLGNHITDSCFQQQTNSLYDSGVPLIVNNVDTAGYTDDHRQLFEQYQVKANLIVPIHVAGQQWGLLIGHHCRDYRDWQADEASLLQEISIQLAIAINQANIHQELQTELRERSQIELGLRESEARYRSIYEQAAVGFANSNLEGQFINVNPRFCEMLGYSKAELLKKTVAEITHPDDQAKRQSIVKPLFSGELPYFFQEKRYVRKDGSYFWSNTGVSLVRDAAGNPKHTLAVIRDITQQKQATLRLRKSEQRYASLAAAVPVGIFRTDLAGNCIYVNRRWCETTGITAAAAAGDGWQKILHPDDRERILTTWARATQAKQAFQAEYRLQRADGSVAWVYGQAVAERNTDGSWAGYVGTVTDISERKQAEEDLKASEQRFRNMAANVPGAIFRYVLHPDGTDDLIDMSAGCYELWEVTAEAVVDNVQVLWDMVHPDDLSAMHESVLTSARTLQPWSWQWRITTPSGQLKWLEAAGRPERCENGDVVWDSLIMDISDRKQIEQELQLSLKALDRHFDTSVLAIIEWEGRQIKRWSKEAERIFGWSEAEIQTMDMATWQFVYEEDFDWVARQMQALRSGEIQSGRFENRNYRKDGRVITCEWHSSVIFDDAGNPQSILSFAQDITERKQAEAQLQNLIAGTAATTGQDFFPALVTHIGSALDVSYVLVTELIDAELSTLAYWANGELQPNFSFPISGTPCEQVQQNGIFYCEHFVQAEFPADLDLVQMEATSYLGIALADANGQAIGNLCILAKKPIQDVQRAEQILRVFAARAAAELERQRATTALEHLNQNLERTIMQRTAALQESEQRFRYLTDYAPVLVWLAEPDKSCNYFNTGWLQFTGCTLAETIGDGWVKNLHPDDRQPCLDHYISAFDARQPFEQEYRLRRFDGVYRWFFETGVPRYSSDGEFLGYIGSCVDISDRKLTEAQLQQTNKELLRATQLKDEFLANMSHELRTPLNAILGISEVLQEGIYGKFNPQQLKAVDVISKSGHHLLDLINDILDVAKIESGQVELHCAPVLVKPLCQASLVFVKQQAFQKNIQLEAKLPSNLPLLHIDERRIRQVLINLLTNAVKFTPKNGHIALEVNQTTNQSLCISIKDTGIGIAPEYLSKLFRPFVQIDSALNRQYTGTGLGLALVKSIIELHGGTVKVTSELGKGSCFTIELPCITDTSTDLSQENHGLEQLELPPVPDTPNSPVILLAEDNEANVMTFASYLRSKGYRLVVANNGQAAIDLIPLEHPDLILMDIQMPGMDGIEAIQRIRHNPHSTDIPIIALTALAMEGDRERCLKVGANDYLTKPVRLKQLAVTIQRLLEGTSTLD